MTPLDLHSEPFARTGNIAGEGFQRLLGRPALGLLQTVIREALQNSVDATPEGSAVEVKLRYRTLTGPELDCFRKSVFSALPPRAADPEDGDADGSTGLEAVISAVKLGVFEISDFNTTGLGGPTRADAVSEKDDMDFVNFLRNVGVARDTHLGGGTYGYGKTSLYALSRCSTIIADSQTTCGGMPVRRIMGCRLGHTFEADVAGSAKRFTGRHWWGRDDGEGGVDPLEGLEAIELADSLGFPKRDETRTGTTIAIIAPYIDENADLGADLAETVLWNFWPRMCASTEPERKINVELEVESEAISLPKPEEFPPLDLFAEALSTARRGEGVVISSQNPKATLGSLAMTRGMCSPRVALSDRKGSLIPKQASHIALMRPVELVVRYLPGVPFHDDRFEWAGVFICANAPEVERAFANAEPPAHDDWIPDMLPKGRAKTFVNVGLREVRQVAQTYAQPKTTSGQMAGEGPSVAETASLLGKHLSQTSSRGPGRRAMAGGGGASRKALSISPPRFVKLAIADGNRLAVFEADLINDGKRPDTILRATPHVVIDGSLTDPADLPSGYAVRLLEMTLRGEAGKGDSIRVGDSGGVVICRVAFPEDAAVGVKFMFSGGDAA